jgi:HEAT repeat protein
MRSADIAPVPRPPRRFVVNKASRGYYAIISDCGRRSPESKHFRVSRGSRSMACQNSTFKKGVAMFRTRYFFLLCAFTVLLFPAASNGRASHDNLQSSAQSPQQQPPAPASQAAKSQSAASQKEAVPNAANAQAASPAAAWTMLTQGANSDKFRERSDVVSALTILDSDRRAIAIISNALADKDETIRVLAATSLGEIKARSAIPKLKEAMDDKSPEVSFAAAQALWKMGDRGGRDIFYEVLDGERKVRPGLLKSKMRQARMDMHDPKALALIGVNEVSGAFLGPFSMGVSVVEEYAKNSGTSVQALCAQLLATDDSHRTAVELTDALGDKNWTVRASAARSLAKLNYHGVMPQLRDMMINDKAQPARFSAAAAIVRLEGRARREVPPPARPGLAGTSPSPRKSGVPGSN